MRADAESLDTENGFCGKQRELLRVLNPDKQIKAEKENKSLRILKVDWWKIAVCNDEVGKNKLSHSRRHICIFKGRQHMNGYNAFTPPFRIFFYLITHYNT